MYKVFQEVHLLKGFTDMRTCPTSMSADHICRKNPRAGMSVWMPTRFFLFTVAHLYCLDVANGQHVRWTC